MFRISMSLLLVAAACAPDVPSTCTPPADPDVVDPCGSTFDGGVVALPGTPDAGQVPTGSVAIDGGTVDRLWFATTGDTRPADCDQTGLYPQAAIQEIAAAMKALRVQFTVDLGDHMYVCNASDTEAQQQMGFYTSAVSAGPSTWWMTMGNHECGSNNYPYSCFTSGPHDANFSAYMSALKRPQPYYFTDVTTSQGKARFVFIADDAWDQTQSAWLSTTLAQADSFKYTIVVRHHPVQGSRTGNAQILDLIRAHKYTLILTAHNHDYEHDLSTWSGRSAVVGLGGAGGYWGFATLLQNADGTLTFVQRDANGNPVGTPWTVTPQ
jgi:Calcineurin-like phosphoesterase